MGIDVRVNLAGLDKAEAAACAVEEKLAELRKAISALDNAVRRVGIEINQPAAGTDG